MNLVKFSCSSNGSVNWNKEEVETVYVKTPLSSYCLSFVQLISDHPFFFCLQLTLCIVSDPHPLSHSLPLCLLIAFPSFLESSHIQISLLCTQPPTIINLTEFFRLEGLLPNLTKTTWHDINYDLRDLDPKCFIPRLFSFNDTDRSLNFFFINRILFNLWSSLTTWK